MELFRQTSNVSMLWEVLLETLHTDEMEKPFVDSVRIIFQEALSTFRSKHVVTLMEVNKQFLAQVMSVIKQLIPNYQSRIRISSQPVHEPILLEEFQTVRQTKFQEQLTQQQHDLEQYQPPKQPAHVPQFQDKKEDPSTKPNVEWLVQQKLAERKYDILPPLQQQQQQQQPSNKHVRFEPAPVTVPTPTSTPTPSVVSFLNKLKPITTPHQPSVEPSVEVEPSLKISIPCSPSVEPSVEVEPSLKISIPCSPSVDMNTLAQIQEEHRQLQEQIGEMGQRLIGLGRLLQTMLNDK